MDNNWIIDNLNYAFSVWNDKLTEMWSLLTQSPQAFKGGTIWQTIQTVNGAMQGIGYGLLVLFLAIGIFRSSAGFRDFQRPEHILRHFIYFVMAKLAVTYGIDLMVDIFAVCAGIISAAAGSVGGIDGATVSLPVEMASAIEDVGFLASIPLWLVTLLGCLLAARVKKDWLVPVPIMLANAVLVGAMLAYVLTPTALVQGFFINGGEVLLGEAVVLYLLGVPLLVFFRKNGVMEKLMKEKR